MVATADPARLSGSSNHGRYGNAALDALLDAALGSFDDAVRGKLVHQAIALVAEEVPLIPLYHPMNIWASRRPAVYQPRLDGRSPVIGAR